MKGRTGGGSNDKGLHKGAMGLLMIVALGVASVAPAYSLTASIGPMAGVIGEQLPAVIVLGFFPMLLVALGYRELNAESPDSGTSFTWTAKAFGPYMGWMAGWGLISANVIVLSNLAGVAVEFFYLSLSEITGFSSLAALDENVWVNIVTCMAFMAGAVWVSYRGTTITKAVLYTLVSMQVVVLGWYSLAAFTASGRKPAAEFSWSWFYPFEIPTFGALAAGLSLSIFLFWGWDVCLAVNEEAADNRRTPGRAATFTVMIILCLYLLVAVSSMQFAGLGKTGIGLANPNSEDSVLAEMAVPVMGPFAIFMSLAVLISSMASLQSIYVAQARTLLAMGHYRALPERFKRVHPRFRSPDYATLAAGLSSGAFYALMSLTSRHVLADTILTLGMMICFYYGLTAFACVFYFRRTIFLSVRKFLFRGLSPFLGGLLLLVVFVRTMMDSMDPSFGSGSAAFGIGLVFLLAVGIIASGAILMLIMSWRRPSFFQCETLPRKRQF
jgi:amino acid transporter